MTKYSLVLVGKASRRHTVRIPWPVYNWFDCVDCVAAVAGAHHGLTRAMVRWAEASGHAGELSRFVVAALNGEVATGPTRVNATSSYR